MSEFNGSSKANASVSNPESAPYAMLLFDLDGTIIDPKEGFVLSFNHALARFGYPERDAKHLEGYIGPPLDVSFSAECGDISAEENQALVKAYRQRYAEQGCRANTLYEGMKPLLLSLAESGRYRLAVCTSKRRDFALKILEDHGLLSLFEFVSGGDVGLPKWQQLGDLIHENKVAQPALMIGDRYYDIQAAQKNALSSAAVTWGYARGSELLDASPDFILQSPAELANLLL